VDNYTLKIRSLLFNLLFFLPNGSFKYALREENAILFDHMLGMSESRGTTGLGFKRREVVRVLSSTNID
jgi:hypothetical protein